LWLDSNRDGISQTDKSFDLEDVGVEGIDLRFQQDGRSDQWGNELRWLAPIHPSDGNTSESVGVFFARPQP
jgi:hypothetical protein